MTASYMIVSREETDDDGRCLCWSNEDGWVTQDSATVFTSAERRVVSLPLGHCAWMIVKVTS